MFQKPMSGRTCDFLRCLIIGLILIAVPATVQAADKPEVPEVEFLATLDASHPAVIALAEELARAEGELQRAATLQNPSLEFEHEAPSGQADQSTFKLGWKPPLDGRRGLAIDAGKAHVEAASRELEWAQLQVRQEMRTIFADWAVAQRRRALVDQHYQSLRVLEERLNVRAARGEESQLAARRFALAVTEVRAELARSEADLARVRGRALAMRKGLPADATPMLPEPPAVPVSLDGSARPDLLARRSEIEAAILRRRLAGRLLEFPTLVAGWTRISASDEDFAGPYFGLSWDVPLFDRKQGDRHQLTRGIAISEARLHLTERDATERKDAALSAYAVLHASLTEIVSVVRDASQVTDAAGASFLAGESNMTDLLETLRSVLESQLSALDLQASVLAAHRELELSVGHALTQGDS